MDRNVNLPKTTIEQWAVLAAVVDEGGFAQAASVLNRSQSAISYSVARLQESLGLALLVVEGRKSVLTPYGQTLLARGRALVKEFDTLEALGRSLKLGWESELKLIVDAAFPRARLLNIVAELQSSCPSTQIQVADVVLSGAEQAITEGSGDLVVTSRVPPGYLSDWLLDVNFIAVARADHPLLKLGRELTTDVLARLAYAWLPEHMLTEQLQRGALQRLPLVSGAARNVSLHIVMVHANVLGPAARAAADAFHRHAKADR